MQTNPQLQLANDFVRFTGKNIFLTGKAGTGKTTFLKELKKNSPKRMVVVAPTGVAAINAGGMTIHSFFQLSFAPQLGNEMEQSGQKRFAKKKINIIRSLDLLVIDEISMVRVDVLDAIDRVFRRFRRNSKPFGGVQLLMIGDLQQLAPVVKNDEWALLRPIYDTAFFFSSLALKQTSFVSIELMHVYRQQDEKFISILNKVRDNKLDRASADILNERYIPNFQVPKDGAYITLCTHNANAKQLNDKEIGLLKTKRGLVRATVEGNFPEYSYPTDQELVLKEGAQVMFVKNDPEPEKRFFNGKIGKITHLSKDDIRVLCPGDEEEIDVSPLVWENIKYSVDEKTAEIKEEKEGSFKQIPLKLAWAITIHKSQGLTFNHAVIDAQSSFAHGQVYVALSRCRTLEGMVLSSRIDERSIINDSTVTGFIRNVEANPPDEKVLSDCKNAYQQEVINDVFDYSRILFFIRGISKVARENSGAFPLDFPKKLEDINVSVTQQLGNVARSFHNQVAFLLNGNADAEANPALQDRLMKAATYFAEKTKSLIISQTGIFNLEVDNKAIAKQINRYLEELEAELQLKMRLFDACEKGFVLGKILDVRAKSVLQGEAKTKRQSTDDKPSFDNIEHPKLYAALRSYRTEKSEEADRPAFFVFSQKTLAELLKYLPVDLKSLKGIKGFGAAKVAQFGEDIIDIIAAYCRENGIDHDNLPQIDFKQEKPKKEKKPKVDTKQVSLDLLNAGNTVEQIAQERDLTTNTIMNHLTYFVAQGELDATDFVDQNKLDLMSEYFKKTKEFSLKPAKEHFGEAISYGELRMGLSYYLSEK